jgi:hypothetical protein
MSAKLISRLSEFVSTQTEEPSKKDLTDALKEIYKSKKNKKSNDGEEKQKRKPSAYNIFYAEQSAVIKKKEEDTPKDERMTAKEKMSYIAKLWKDQKTGEKFETAPEAVSEEESEITPAPEAVSEEESEITLAPAEPEVKAKVAIKKPEEKKQQPAAKTSAQAKKGK